MRLNGGLMTAPPTIMERRTILNFSGEPATLTPKRLPGTPASATACRKGGSAEKASSGEALLERGRFPLR